MARLFAFLANRPDLGSKILEAEASLINPSASPFPLGWGAGFYQGGEVLLRRRPVDERSPLPLSNALADVRSTVLLGHVRQATVGALSTENTHPFRYRQLLFAHTGTLPAYASLRGRLLDAIPQFLRRNVRGDTDSELLFHLSLSFLHDQAALDQNTVPPSEMHRALRSTLALIDRLSAEEGGPPHEGNFAITDGETLVAVHTGTRMAYRVYQGRQDFENIFGEDGLRKARSSELENTHLQLMVADYEGEPSRFTQVPARSILTLSRATDPILESLY